MRRANPSTRGSAGTASSGRMPSLPPRIRRNTRFIDNAIHTRRAQLRHRTVGRYKILDRSRKNQHLSPALFELGRRLFHLMHAQTQNQNPNLAGLWVLLVQNDGELKTQDAEGRVPVMARAG